MKKRSKTRLRAIVEGAATVLDLGVRAEPERYRGPECDARELSGDFAAVGAGIRRSMTKAGAVGK